MKTFLFFNMLSILVFCSPHTLSAAPAVIDGDVPSEGGFRRITIAQGLEHPWSLAWLPNGDLLITERPGRLRRIRDGRLLADPIAGVPKVYASGQGGLLDLCLHPNFKENSRLFFTYAHGSSSANRTRVATATLNGMNIENWQVIFEVATSKRGSQHFGSRMVWLPDSTLLVTIGDGGNPPVRMSGDWIRKQAQNKASHLGKIIRINMDGSLPADNPFIDIPGADPFVWSYGHRNIQGIAYDSIRASVWASEHGALGGDELNRILAGENFGWPLATYSREYVGGLKISEYTSKPGMQNPQVVWMNAIAPSGLTLYTGKAFPKWQGDLFVGGLKSQDIRRVDLDPAGNVMGQSALRIGQRVRDVRQGPDGLLYVLTDESNGSLIRLEPAGDSLSPRAP
jgi:glucose/arabinose dehydrogenase